MNNEFQSIFAPYLKNYLAERKALGYKYDKDSGHFVDPNNKPEPEPKTEEKADDKKKAK